MYEQRFPEDLWYHQYPERLRMETEAMQERFGQFRLTIGDTGDVAWDGYLRTNRDNTYRVAVLYPRLYPFGAPSAFLLSPRSQSQHLSPKGEMCLMTVGDKVWRTNTTAVAIIALAAAWLFAYETHEEHCRCGPGYTPCREVVCPHWPGPKV